ncbi:hypothetical protein GW17_00004996 [Ensete ventricosum]|nr:hypothetical protein GW17_00004996 [Ensete ventricosum]
MVTPNHTLREPPRQEAAGAVSEGATRDLEVRGGADVHGPRGGVRRVGILELVVDQLAAAAEVLAEEGRVGRGGVPGHLLVRINSLQLTRNLRDVNFRFTIEVGRIAANSSMAGGDQTESLTSSSKATKTMADKTLKGFGNLIRVLPSGTVFIYQFLNPLLTNKGDCHVANKYLTAALLCFCGFFCCFSSFTDSYTGSDRKLHYGVATKDGLWAVSDESSGSVDLSKYKLRFGDFVHAFFALVVFAAISLLDSNSVSCFYPSFGSQQKVVLMVLPPVLGAIASSVFMVFPNTRHGIGYPPSETTSDSSE